MTPTARALGLALGLGGSCWACGTMDSARPAASPDSPSDAPIDFAFGTTEGAVVDAPSTRGRATAVLFVTTYDAASQVAAQQLDGVLTRFRPRSNGVVVVMETPKYAMLADVFRSTLHLHVPVAIADDATRTGIGGFGPIDQIPTLIVLDRDGRIFQRRAGLATPREVGYLLERASRRGSAVSPMAPMQSAPAVLPDAPDALPP